MKRPFSIAGRIAAFSWQQDHAAAGALAALGACAVMVVPREEEPQIDLTLANVLVPFPGASVRDVERRRSPGSST
jgi:multidrug efflux pump subunit AcrB